MDALNQIVEGIRTAFHPTPLQVALALAAIFIFVSGLVAFYLIERSRHRREDRMNARRMYQSLRDRHQLAPSEEDLISRMAMSLKLPEKKHLLLSNQGLFNACAHRLMQEGEIPEAAVSALRVKLGFFGEGLDGVPVSTASLPTGAPLLLRYRGTNFRARVLDLQTGSIKLRVALGGRAAIFFPGSDVEILYQNRRGTFSMKTTVLKQEGELLRLAHSEEVDRSQQREHYRREVNLPVYVRPAGSDERPVQSRFLDLGGGGASLYNPGGRYRGADDVELTFHPDSDERLSLSARVVRTSHGHSVIHVDFGQLRESVRDRIYRVLFNKTTQQ